MVGTALGDDMVLATGPLFEPIDAEGPSRSTSGAPAPRRAPSSSRSRSATCPRSSRWSTTARCGRASATAASPAEVAAWSARPATATTWPMMSSSAPATASAAALGTPVCSPPTPWWPEARISGRAAPARVKFRYYHKQRGFVAEYGRPSCVGCGRCISACPVKIDISEVISQLRRMEENATAK